MHTQNFKEWKEMAGQLGLTLENNGGGKLVAHRDGEELGEWDPNYAGVGMGTFYPIQTPQANPPT